MAFLDLRTRAAYLVQLVLRTDVSPSADWPALVNSALTDFSWDTEYNQEEVTFSTVANQAEYTITGQSFKTIKDVAYGTNQALYKSSESEERRGDDLWYLRTAAQPSRYVVSRGNVVRLIPKPVNSGDIVTVRGTRAAPALSADTDVPGCPDTFQEAIALRAAWLHCQTMATDEISAAVISGYDVSYRRYVADLRLWLSQERYNGQLQRRVSRPRRPRLPVRGFYPL